MCLRVSYLSLLVSTCMLVLALSTTLSTTLMGKPRRKIKSWDDVVTDLAQANTRFMLVRRKKSPYLQIIERKSKKQFSLAPIYAWDNQPEILRVFEFIIELGDAPWPAIKPEEIISDDFQPEKIATPYTWEEIKELTRNHCLKKNKGIDNNVGSDINKLVKISPAFNWQDIKNWLFEKEIESRGFLNRLNSLEQIRLAILNKFGEEPNWLQRSNMDQLREQHNIESKKVNRYKTTELDIRGIPTKEEAEKYLASLCPKFPLEQWYLAMQLNYGLRNHSLHHISIIKRSREDEGLIKGHVFVPGKHRTKSFEHYVWPLYPSWITKFGLITHFEKRQAELRERVKMKIVSAIDKTKPWKEGNPKDLGVCINNRQLGEWITRRMKHYLPPWFAEVPDAQGLPDSDLPPERVTPYDLRHTWAIRMATDPSCSAITDEQAAKAMGHSLEIHRRNYQKWLSKTEVRRQYMSQIEFPSD